MKSVRLRFGSETREIRLEAGAARIGDRKVDIIVKARGDAELEIWSARSRSRLFAKVFARTVGCQQE